MTAQNNHKPKAPPKETPRSARPIELQRELTPEQARLRDWVDLRNAWIRSGGTGFEDGRELPNLGPRPPDPPTRVAT